MQLNQSTAGLRVLRHILDMEPKEAGDAIGRATPFLTYDEDKKALDFIRSHFSMTGKMPHQETVLDNVAVFLPPLQEVFSYDLAILKNRYVEDAMRDASDKASALIVDGKAQDALKAMLADLLPLTQQYGGHELFDLRKAQQSGLAFYKSQLDGTAPPVQTLGIPTLDEQGGIEDGDMIGLVGRPASGKTWLMLMLSMKYWAEQEKGHEEPVLFVTQEMSRPQIEKRAIPLAAGVDPTPMYKGTPIQYQLHGHTPETYMQALEDAAANLATGKAPFLIYDSKMAGTVADIESIASVHGVRKVFIDGAYMLRHPDPRLGRYQRVPENLDLMKQFCQRTGCATVTSWQFKRGAGKDDAAGETPDLDDIGYSHSIGEYMGVVLGLLENPKSVEQMNKKTVTIMKGRNGEVGNFQIHWDFQNMNFEEVTVSESNADLTYL